MVETRSTGSTQRSLMTTRRLFLRACGASAASVLAGCQTADRIPELPMVSLPGRHSVLADQLVILSDFRLDYDHKLITDLTQLRKDVLRVLELDESDRPVVVYLFDNETKYFEYLTSTWPGLPYRRAYFFGNSYELAVYTSWGDRVLEDLRHEFTHGILHSALRTVPLWLDEGLAEYFEVVGDHPGTINRTTVERISLALSKGWRPNLTRLEGLKEVSDMGQADYEEAWGWVHFMLHSEPAVREVLIGYLADLKTMLDPEPLSVRLAAELPAPGERFTSYLASLNTFGPPPDAVNPMNPSLADAGRSGSAGQPSRRVNSGTVAAETDSSKPDRSAFRSVLDSLAKSFRAPFASPVE